MKSLFLLTIFSISIFAQDLPYWFYKLNSKSDTNIIGYGQGESLREAKRNAREDIAKQIKTTISSSFSESTSIGANNYKKSLHKQLKEKTNATLEDIKLLKKEKSENGEYFVALSYENIPFLKRFAKKLNLKKCKEKQNSYLKHSFLISKINKQTKCTPNIKLQRKNRTWYLIHRNTIQELPYSFYDELYTSKANININLKASKKSLKEGDEFFFTAKPKKDGYISLLTVYENGVVTVLLPNIEVKANETIQIPSEDYGAVLEAGLVKANRPTFDLYVAIFSNEAKDFSRYEQANEDLSKGESNKKFDELIEQLDTEKFASILLRTRP